MAVGHGYRLEQLADCPRRCGATAEVAGLDGFRHREPTYFGFRTGGRPAAMVVAAALHLG
jgi:hypothetical protein